MIEVELKFKVPPEGRLSLLAKLETLSAIQWLGSRNIADVYYDTVGFDCFQQAVFIRTRNEKRLDIKYHEEADPTHTHCTELTFHLPANPLQVEAVNKLCSRFIPAWRDAETIEDALHHNDLMAFVHLNNQRTRYAYKDLILCVDHIEGLGDFFEVETSCQQKSEIVAAQATLQEFVASLALDGLHLVKVGYVELWLRLHLPQVYLLGIYQGGEDLERVLEGRD